MRSGIMLCYPWEEKRLASYGKPYLVQPKLNGDRCRVIIEGDSIKLLSSECNEITSLPHINIGAYNFWMRIAGYYGGSVEFDGELYNCNLPHQYIHSIVSRRKDLHLHYTMIQLWLFDTPSDLEPQLTRTRKLEEAFNIISIASPSLTSIRLVPSRHIDTLKGVYCTLRLFHDAGYEGVVVKNPSSLYVRGRSVNWMKIKPRRFDRYKIVGYQQECDIYGSLKDSLGAFVVQGSDGKEFRVGTGFTLYQRLHWWEERDRLIGTDILVIYPELTKRGIPANPVFKCLYEEGMECKGREEI